MKNKKGFTLVELLAVIAILAILVIISLPNVIGMFNEAKKNSFITELRNIYKLAGQQWINDSLFETAERTYSRCETCTGKSLQLSGRQNLDYYVVINKAGEVTKFYATDGTFQYQYEGSLLPTDITDAELVADLDDDDVLKITNDTAYTGELPKLVTVLKQKEEGILSVGDEILIDNKEGFYVIESNSSETKLLAKYNLLVGFVVQTAENGNGGKEIVREISPSENGYGWQSQLTENRDYGTVPFSGKTYWQSTENPNNYAPGFDNPRSDSMYRNSMNTVAPVVRNAQNAYGYKMPEVEASDYTIAYYLEPYILKLKSLGVNVIEGNLLSHTQATSLGCTMNHNCDNYKRWMWNTAYWTASVSWEGQTSNQNNVFGVNRGFYQSAKHSYAGQYGIRPVITLNTSDIELKDHEYFVNNEPGVK